MSCTDLEKITNIELFHSPKMKDSFDNIPEDLQERMTQKEHESYYLEPEKEIEFEKEHKKTMIGHLLNCNNDQCETILKNWLNEPSLKKQIEDFKK